MISSAPSTKAGQDDMLQTIGRIHEDVLLEEAPPGHYVQHSVVYHTLPNGETLRACALCNDLKEFVDEIGEKAVAEDREHQPAYKWALGERELLKAALQGREYLGERYDPPAEALKDLASFTGDHISRQLEIEAKLREGIEELRRAWAFATKDVRELHIPAEIVQAVDKLLSVES